jgi:hypothetical protein
MATSFTTKDYAGETDAYCAFRPPLSQQPEQEKEKEQKLQSYGGYTLYRYEEVEQKWLSFASLEPETLCWVLQSKGKKQRGKGKHSTSSSNGPGMVVHDSAGEKQRKELLSRAWIVGEEEFANHGNNNEKIATKGGRLQSPPHQPRFLMRYPKGSTYHVKRDNLLPVLQESHLVIVLPETNLYRRWALVHTRHNDSFCEIGCDVGILVHRIWEHSSCPHNVCGIDKALEDIHQAQQRFPRCNFQAWEVPLLGEQQQSDKDKLPMNLFSQPSDTMATNQSLVVAIDINGNRELEAVQKCIQIVIQEWKPRLIVVKSRALYADLTEQ